MKKAPRDKATMAEIVTSFFGVFFTVALIGFTLVQAVVTGGPADAQVQVVSAEPAADGRVRVAVEVTNTGGVGLLLVRVRLDCGDPQPELDFDHLPVGDKQTGELYCPAGTRDPTAEIVSLRGS